MKFQNNFFFYIIEQIYNALVFLCTEALLDSLPQPEGSYKIGRSFCLSFCLPINFLRYSCVWQSQIF